MTLIDTTTTGHARSDALSPPARRRRTKPAAIARMSTTAAIAAGEEQATGQFQYVTHAYVARRKKKPAAKPALSPTCPLSAGSEQGAGHHAVDIHAGRVRPSESAVAAECLLRPDTRCRFASAVTAIRELQVQRIATMRMQIRIDNQCRSLVRRAMGWRWEMSEKERKAINEAASDLVEAIQSGEATAEPVAEALRPFCLMAREGRRPFDTHRANVEKRMKELARSLPVWSWVESVRGLGDLGLAIIVGESGDLSDYANPGKLWKRFGLAPKPCYIVDRGEGPVAEIPKRRRSAIWTVADSLLKQQNPYRDLYLARKQYERDLAPDMTPMHSHRRAARYAEKRMILDLWKAWTGK